MYGIELSVAGSAVRRGVDGRRPGPNHVFVVADVEVVNRGDAPVALSRVPAVFLAADGTQHDPAVPALWPDEEVVVGAYETAVVKVLFDVARTKAAGGAVRIVRGDGPTGRRLHLAS
ncbi:hypothetical protein [Mumia zhuanghuii]|uniref:DUF4352 domain-containing protein n=1 Tax=Mumia zhuanghuii TaxID=2585211 RepID=A0A5C4MT62_9ACTN|nr:hypothetical protein [Mumia zhuanghuii]TNC49055.1 hypothetical protein FHE65_06285 [Mumia zhuanghuii]TNC49061.1 hypothetical protein FHE65_06230 [Mumia zhuanghuii]